MQKSIASQAPAAANWPAIKPKKNGRVARKIRGPEAIKRKAVSADSLSESLTTFDDLYQEALPEERRELIRLRVNQLVWTPDEIRLALFDTPQRYQRFSELQQLVAQTLDSSNIGLVWDKFHIYQGHMANAPYIRIGQKGRKPRCLKIVKDPNPIKRAHCFQELLDSGEADSQGDLSRRIGIPRTTITAYLRLLDLDAEVQAEALALEDDDERLSRLTEARLRHLVGQEVIEQRKRFKALLKEP